MSQRVSKRIMVPLLEVSILIGIGVGYVATPRNFPISWFLGIAAGFFIMANVLLLNAFKSQADGEANRGINRLRSKRMYLALVLMATYWMLVLFWR